MWPPTTGQGGGRDGADHHRRCSHTASGRRLARRRSPNSTASRRFAAGERSPTRCTPAVVRSPPSSGTRAPRAVSTTVYLSSSRRSALRAWTCRQPGRARARHRRTRLRRRCLRPSRHQRPRRGIRRRRASRRPRLPARPIPLGGNQPPQRRLRRLPGSSNPLPGRGRRRRARRGGPGVPDHLPLLAVEDEPLRRIGGGQLRRARAGLGPRSTLGWTCCTRRPGATTCPGSRMRIRS